MSHWDPFGSEPPPPYSEKSSSSWGYGDYQPYYDENGTLMIPVEVPDDAHVKRVNATTAKQNHRAPSTSKPKANQARKVHRPTPATLTTVTNYVTVTPAVKNVTNIITPTVQVPTAPVPKVQVTQNLKTAGPVIYDPPSVKWVGVDPMSADAHSGQAVLGGQFVEKKLRNSCYSSCYYRNYNSSYETKTYPLWIMRAWKDGNLIPGRVSASQKKALIPYNGKGVEVHEIEVLCVKPEMVRWEETSLGNVPPGAIPGGVTATGETLYIGRAKHEDSVIPGMVQPSKKCCFIVSGSDEITKTTYEVLICK